MEGHLGDFGIPETRSIEDFCIRGLTPSGHKTFSFRKREGDADYSFVHKWIDDPQICQVEFRHGGSKT